MAKLTQSEEQQKAIESIVGKYNLNLDSAYPQDDEGEIRIDTKGNFNGIACKYISKSDKDGNLKWVVGLF